MPAIPLLPNPLYWSAKVRTANTGAMDPTISPAAINPRLARGIDRAHARTAKLRRL